MPLVKITDSDLQEITTVELSRVPCVGEHIMLLDKHGNGAPHNVESVYWDVCKGRTVGAQCQQMS